MHYLGATRSSLKHDHLLQTPDTFVRIPLPGATGVEFIIHASPQLGANFSQMTAEFSENGTLGPAPGQRFIYVLEGELDLMNGPNRHLLGIGGFVAVMGEAQPGDTLYGVHTKVFGEPASVHDERIASSAQDDLDTVEQMITQGQWDQAQDKLDAVSDRVQAVQDNDRKQDLVERVNLLNAKVANRDPRATTLPSLAPNSMGG